MKKILSVILCLCMLLAMMPTSVSVCANTGTANDTMEKGVLLYVGYSGYGGSKYHVPSDDALRLMLSTTDEVLLIPIVTYNRYTDANGVERQILSNDVINSMTADMVGNPARLATIKSEYISYAASRIAANYHVNDYIADATELGNRLVAINPNVKLWYSVPSAEGFHALTHLFVDSWKQVVDGIKGTLSDTVWNNNVQGFYYCGEDIVTSGYTKFNVNNVAGDFDNPIVYAMHQVSDKVHAYGKNMLWIPYYHAASASSTNLGYVANKTNIFDTVIMQPSYFFHAERESGVEIIRNSVARQAVVDASGAVIGGTKTSNTQIGFEMEIDERYFTDSAYRERYQAYVDAFAEFVGQYPTVYYASSPEVMLTLTKQMTAFFRGEAKAKYILPTNDISAWVAERTANSSYGYAWNAPLTGDTKSDEINGEVTKSGSMRFTLTGNLSYPTARIQNNSGLVWLAEEDYINLDVTLEGELGGTDVRWGLEIAFIGGRISINQYVAEAAGVELHAGSQLKQGRYRVSLQIGDLLRAYDADKGLTGTNSYYQKVFGEGGNKALTQVWFTMFSNTPAQFTDVGLVVDEFNVASYPLSPVYTRELDMYSLPVESPEEWLTWETPNDLPSSQNIDAEVTEEGLRLSFADTATQQIPVAFVRNISGLAKVEKGDKLVLNATLEGDAGGMDIRWRFQLQFAGAGVNIVVSKYVGEAAGLAANEYGQLPQGDYNVVLDIEQLLKDYDADNNLTGENSTYEKVFGVNGNNALTNIYFNLATNTPGTTDGGKGLLIRRLAVRRNEDFYYPEVKYALPTDDISAWVAERTSDSPYGYAWNAPLTGDTKSDEINGAVTADGAMRLTLSGSFPYPAARVHNYSGLVDVEKGDYLNIDVTLEGTPGGTDVRWGLDLVFAVGQININKYVAEAAGVELFTYSQLKQGTYTLSLDLDALLMAYDADNGLTGTDSMYEKVLGANGNPALTQVWFTMFSNTPAQHTNVGLVVRNLTVTDGMEY